MELPGKVCLSRCYVQLYTICINCILAWGELESMAMTADWRRIRGFLAIDRGCEESIYKA